MLGPGGRSRSILRRGTVGAGLFGGGPPRGGERIASLLHLANRDRDGRPPRRRYDRAKRGRGSAESKRGVSTGLSRAGSILRGGFWPRATSCRRRVAPSRARTPRPAATTATTGSRQPGGELAIPRGPHGSRQEKGVGGQSSRRLVEDDGLDAIHLLDLREQALGYRRLRHDESVRVIDDLRVVHDDLPNRDPCLRDDRRDTGQDPRFGRVRGYDLDGAPVHERRDFTQVADRPQGIIKGPQLGVLVDRLDGRGHDSAVDAGGAGHRGVRELDLARVHVPLVDAQAVHDHELGDLLLRREPLEIVTEACPPKASEPLFPKELIRQEMSPNRAEPIPEELREAYLRLGRPTPLYRAKRLEAFLKTPARIYYKREDLSPVGSHKPNTAFAQAYFAAQEGVEALATETGAGQWGSALALAANYFGLKAKVFMVRVSYDQKPYRKYVMNLYGADVIPSPSDQTNVGKKFLAQDPDHPGSLGIAISEAIESAVTGKNTKYSLGSVLNHVLMHQTIIGLEAQKQFELADVTPDFMVGSVGGGSNFGGFTYPMIGERIHGNIETKFVAVEPKSVPSMTQGRYEYDFGDTGEMTPLVKMHTLGHTFVPPRIHAGGLRYHGTAATLSVLLDSGLVEPRAADQVSTFQAGEIFAKTEGLIPAPETCHAIRGAIDLALEAKARNEATTIAFNYSGHGLLDLEGYRQFMEGTLKNNGK